MTKHVKGAAIEGALPMQMRLQDSVEASSFNAETREVDLMVSSGVPVRRRSWDGPYMEELVVSEAAINMERLNAGAAVLDSHDVWRGLDASLGVVVKAWIKSKQLMVRIRLHAIGVSEAADRLAGMISGGTAPKVSTGYTVDAVRIIEPTKSEIRKWIVERWTPYEISFVTVPAEAGAGVRSASDEYPVEFNRAETPIQEETTMTEKVNGNASTGAEPVETRAAVDAGVKAERERGLAIRKIAADHKLPDALVAKAIEGGTEVDAFRALALDHLASAQERQAPTVSSHGSASGDDPAVVRGAMIEAMTSRVLISMGVKREISEQARGFIHHGFADIAGEILGVKSVRTAAQRDDVLHRAFHTTSDFPGLLENVANKVLLDRYQAAQPTYRNVARKRNFTDFKPHAMLRAGDFPPLLLVGETGEIKAGTVSESKETISLATYARQVRFSRNMLINDDMNAMGDVLGSIGSRVADFENATFWAKYVSNPVLTTDGLAVWHATHGNLAAPGTAIDVTTVGAGRAAMMKQTSLDGLKLNITPKFLIVGPDLMTVAEQFTTTVVATQTSNANVLGPRLTAIGDANIVGDDWFLQADPGQAETHIYGYLNGAEGPQTRIDEPFGVLGVALQVVLDFAVGANDFRGTYKNPGPT